MSELLETAIRDALSERAATLDTTAPAERLLAADYRTPRRPRTPRFWSAIGATSAALTAGIITAILLLSSSTPAAYAGWTPVPTTPTPSAAKLAAAACTRPPEASYPVLKGPILTEARGRYTAVLFTGGKVVQVCISDGRRGDTSQNGDTLILGSYAKPGPDQLGMPGGAGGGAPGFPGFNSFPHPLPPSFRVIEQTWKRRFRSDPTLVARLEASLRSSFEHQDFEESLYGRAGGKVVAVTLLFAGGPAVSATVEHGWYFAWWPSRESPSSIRVTTTSRVVTSRMTYKPDRAGCVFAGFQPQSNS